MSIAYEINRLQTSKADTKEQVNIDKDYINTGIDFIGSETVDDYDEKIQEMQEAYKAFIPINTTSDTQIDAPKGGTIIGKTLKGNTSQSGTPTPSAPVAVNNVTGEQVVRVCKKNLFDKNTEVTIGKYYNSTGDVVNDASNTLFIQTFYINVLPNTRYNFSANGNDYFRMCEYAIDKTFIQRQLSNTGTTNTYYFITSPNTYFIRVSCATSNIDSLQIEKGTSVTSFEPYQDTTLYMNYNKNLLKINDTSKTINGITFTENSDGSIHAEGTATNLAYYGTNTLLPILPSQRYRLSGCPEGGSLSSYYISIMLKNESGSGIGSFADIGDGVFGDFIAPDSARYMYAQILILSGTTINATFYPQLELGSEITPYKEYEPLQEGNYEINLGKNLANPSDFKFYTQTNASCSYDYDTNTLTMTTLRATTNNNLFFCSKIDDNLLKNGKTYTISSVDVSGVYKSLKLQLRNKDGSNANKSMATSVTYDNTYSLYIVENPFASSGSTNVPQGSVAVIKDIQVEERKCSN